MNGLTPRFVRSPRTALCGLGVSLAAIACTGSGPPGTSEPAARTGSVATILVENEGQFTMAIHTDISPMRLGTVPPGGTVCLLLQRAGIQRLTARPSGGDEAVVSPFFDPVNARGWRWQVGSSPVAGGPRLAPDDRCDP